MYTFLRKTLTLVIFLLGTATLCAGNINVAWPVANQKMASIKQDGTLCRFTASRDYAQVTIQLKNNNTMWSSHDLQVRMFDGVQAGVEYNVTTAVPGEVIFELFKGDTYTMVIKGFVNYWDVMPDNYESVVEIPIIGDGKAHEKVSSVKLLSMSPAGTPMNPGEMPMVDGKLKLTFDGAVSSVTAVNTRGMEGSTTYTGAAVPGTAYREWEVSFGDLSSLASSETEYSIFNLAITAKASDGGAVVFDETKSDFRLEASWILFEGEPQPKKELGTPSFSLPNLAVVEALPNMSVSVSFPYAQGYDGMKYSVSGTLWDQNFQATPVSTKGQTSFGSTPAAMQFATTPRNSYSLAITNITIYDASGAVVETLKDLPYNINFTTTDYPTAIDAIHGAKAPKDGKYLENGKVIIVRKGTQYQISGM